MDRDEHTIHEAWLERELDRRLEEWKGVKPMTWDENAVTWEDYPRVLQGEEEWQDILRALWLTYKGSAELIAKHVCVHPWAMTNWLVYGKTPSYAVQCRLCRRAAVSFHNQHEWGQHPDCVAFRERQEVKSDG